MYKLLKNIEGEVKFVYRLADKTTIPLEAPDNRDYQQYLAWLAEGNTPEDAE